MWSTQGTTRTFITQHHTAVQRGLGGPGTGRWYLCHCHTAVTLLGLRQPLWLLTPLLLEEDLLRQVCSSSLAQTGPNQGQQRRQWLVFLLHRQEGVSCSGENRYYLPLKLTMGIPTAPGSQKRQLLMPMCPTGTSAQQAVTQ